MGSIEWTSQSGRRGRCGVVIGFDRDWEGDNG
jgi:hypothetical protein